MDTHAAIVAERQVRHDYAAIGARAGAGDVRTVLHVGDHASALAWGRAREPDGTLVLAVGAADIARDGFAGRPPTALAIEHAIQHVEDAVFPAHRHLPPASVLYSADAGMRALARAAGLPAAELMRLDLAALEGHFGRLAAVAQGSPAAHQGFAPDPDLAARIVILREFLHHAGFAAILLMAPA